MGMANMAPSFHQAPPPLYLTYKVRVQCGSSCDNMMEPQPSTSSAKETDLSLAQGVFEGTITKPTIEAEIVVRRRKRGKAFVATDLVFDIQFRQSTAGNLPVLSCLVSVHQVMLTLIAKLKEFFDDKKRRLAFFSAHVDQMTSSIYSGGVSLHEQPEQEIAQQILRLLFMYLVSKNKVDLNSNLIIKVCVMSLDHTLNHDILKHGRRQLPGPDHLIGHQGSSLKEVTHYLGPCHGLIIIPEGYPVAPCMFAMRCLPVAFAVGDMLSTAARTGKAEGKKMLFELRGLSQRAYNPDKQKNIIGRKIWAQTQFLLDQICWPSKGPFTYALLDKLCKHFGYQAAVFSGLINKPSYFFPLDQPEPRPDCPWIFLQEVQSLNSDSPVKFHTHLIVRLEQVFKKKIICSA